jgi:hypothetical protein
LSKPTDRLSREEAHKSLDRWLDVFETPLGEDQYKNYSNAHFHLSMLIADIGRMLPLDHLKAAYGLDNMLDASTRMSFITWLFERVEDQDAPYSANSLRHELGMLANGDAPKLFAQKEKRPGRPTNAHELARAGAQAFYWDSLLDVLGIPAGRRQAEIGFAFLKPWDTLRKNKSAIIGYLGEEEFNEVVERGATIGKICREEDQLSYHEALNEAGEEYRALHRYRR